MAAVRATLQARLRGKMAAQRRRLAANAAATMDDAEAEARVQQALERHLSSEVCVGEGGCNTWWGGHPSLPRG